MLELSPDEWVAVHLSLRIALVATAVALPFGLALAWLLARKQFWGKALLDGLVHMPLVLPPVVTGYLLLISFGRRGPRVSFACATGPSCFSSAARSATPSSNFTAAGGTRSPLIASATGMIAWFG